MGNFIILRKFWQILQFWEKIYDKIEKKTVMPIGEVKAFRRFEPQYYQFKHSPQSFTWTIEPSFGLFENIKILGKFLGNPKLI